MTLESAQRDFAQCCIARRHRAMSITMVERERWCHVPPLFTEPGYNLLPDQRGLTADANRPT